jgi:uncharacterized protein (TIGR02246 family)
MRHPSRPQFWRASAWALLSLASAALIASCSRVDLAAERAALLKRDSEWHAAVVERKDAAKIASFFTEDGILVGSGEPAVIGREALTKAMQGIVDAPVFEDNWHWTRIELSSDGRFAHLYGSTQLTVSGVDGKPVTTNSRLLNVWRKGPDGVWRCAVDMWVDEPATAVSAGLGR